MLEALDQENQLTVTRVAARRVARLQVLQAEAVPPALVRAPEAGRGITRFRLGQEVAQPRSENRDGTPATMLEDEHIEIGIHEHGLESQQADGRVQNEAVPGGPDVLAGPAGLEGQGGAVEGHYWKYRIMRETMSARRIAVLGMGNPVVSDDRVGLAVAEELRRVLDQEPIDGVTVLESTRGGFELIDLLSGFAAAIIIDCLTLPEPSPGRVRRLSLDNVSGSARLVNAHEISITQAFQLAAKMGIDMPQSVEIFAIEGGDTSTISEEMTPAVAAAVEPLAREIHALIATRPGRTGVLPH